MTPWQGKWALVTGASAGIGRELAVQLAAGGANLVLTARRADRLQQLASDLSRRHKVATEVCVADLSIPQAPEDVFSFTQERGLAIDVLVNNAGFGAYGKLDQIKRERLLEMLQVNVTAVAHLTHLYMPAMIERRFGYILIVSSTAAFQPVPYIAAYAATKAFDLIFAEGIAEELRGSNVNVCALCPGSTVSEFHAAAGQPQRTFRRRESAAKVARVGLEALAAGKHRVISGFRNELNVELQRLLPRRVVTRVAANLFAPPNSQSSS
jgi:short-subunit dehydrogenase